MATDFRPMQPIALQTNPARGEAWFPSVVLDYEEGEWLSIGVPMRGGGEVPVRPGSVVHLQITRTDGLRRFQAEVRGRTGGESSPPALALAWPRELEKIQRRDNVRVDASYGTTLRVLNTEGENGEPIEGATIDLSAGGVRVRMPSPVPDLSTVELTLNIPTGRISCGARVVRGGEFPHARGDLRYWLALEFTSVEPAVRREITRLVFALQREILRREGR